MGKAEARIARQEAKLLKQAEKSARIKERPEFREIRIPLDPDDTKEVRAGANPGSIYSMQVTWTIDEADRAGEWNSGTSRDWTEDCWQTILHPKLSEFEKLTWGEIDTFTTGGKERHKMHHDMEVSILADEAQYRLIEIEKYADIIFRFRLGAKRRLWGYRILNKFEAIWYDPNHEIYPVDP